MVELREKSVPVFGVKNYGQTDGTKAQTRVLSLVTRGLWSRNTEKNYTFIYILKNTFLICEKKSFPYSSIVELISMVYQS